MKIEIRGVEYAFDISGTVGLVYMAQRLLGEEKFDGQNQYHQLVLFYSAFFQSNKAVKNVPDLQDFITSMTSKRLGEITEYFWKRWNELEGVDPESEKEDEQGEE